MYTYKDLAMEYARYLKYEKGYSDTNAIECARNYLSAMEAQDEKNSVVDDAVDTMVKGAKVYNTAKLASHGLSYVSTLFAGSGLAKAAAVTSGCALTIVLLAYLGVNVARIGGKISRKKLVNTLDLQIAEAEKKGDIKKLIKIRATAKKCIMHGEKALKDYENNNTSNKLFNIYDIKTDEDAKHLRGEIEMLKAKMNGIQIKKGGK